MLIGLKKFGEIEKRRQEGDYFDDIKKLFPVQRGQKIKQQPPTPTPPKEKPKPKLGKVIEELKEQKIKHKQWRPNTIRNHQPKINTMLQVLGDRPVNYITEEDTKKLAKLLDLLPPGFSRKKEDISNTTLSLHLTFLRKKMIPKPKDQYLMIQMILQESSVQTCFLSGRRNIHQGSGFPYWHFIPVADLRRWHLYIVKMFLCMRVYGVSRSITNTIEK